MKLSHQRNGTQPRLPGIEEKVTPLTQMTGRLLNEWRRKRRVSQRAVTERAGISRETQRKMGSPDYAFSFEVAERYARAIGVLLENVTRAARRRLLPKGRR